MTSPSPSLSCSVWKLGIITVAEIIHIVSELGKENKIVGNKSEEDAFEDDMEPLDSDELADLEVMGDDDVQSVDDSQVSEEERQAAEELEKNAAESGVLEDEGVTEDEIDKEVQQELEEAGLTDSQQ